MKNISNRLKLIRKEKHLTQQDLGDALGVSKQAIANIESNHNYPSIELICKLIENFKINSNWFLVGEGKMFIENKPSATDDELEQKVVSVMKKYGVIEK